MAGAKLTNENTISPSAPRSVNNVVFRALTRAPSLNRALEAPVNRDQNKNRFFSLKKELGRLGDKKRNILWWLQSLTRVKLISNLELKLEDELACSKKIAKERVCDPLNWAEYQFLLRNKRGNSKEGRKFSFYFSRIILNKTHCRSIVQRKNHWPPNPIAPLFFQAEKC